MTDPQKSPLDVLEDILKDAKGAAADNQAQQAADQTVATEQQELANLNKLRQQKKLEDEQQIQQQLVEMQHVLQSPEEQERQRQEQTVTQQTKDNDDAQDGFQIVQLDHTKI